MKTWFLFSTISAPMPFQMMLDERLFRDAEEKKQEALFPLLRFYFSSEPWVSVGYSYRNGESENGNKICRRLTGGGRVLHGHDVIFSLIARKTDDESFRSVRTSYLKIHEAVKKGFELLGFKPRFYRCDENLPRGKDCFLYPIATDLALGREKIAGGAEKRSSGVFLHQESVKVPRGIDADEMTESIRKGFEAVFEIRFKNADLSPELLAVCGRPSPAFSTLHERA